MTQTLIIGAGITGAALAYQLSQRGEAVTIVSTHAEGGLASASSFGWLNASFYLSRAHYHLRHEGMAAHRRLGDALPGGKSYSITQNQDQVPIRCVPCWKFGAIDNILRIRKAVQQVNPDVVLFNIQFASFADKKIPATLGLFTPWLLKVSGFKVAVLLHNIMETVNLKSAGFGGNPIVETVIRFFGNIVTRFILTADIVAVTIPKYVEILEEKFNAKNVLLAPHGSFEEPTDAEPKPMPGGCPTVMTFGKFGTYKTVDLLIESHAMLQKKHPDLRLVIAGTDSPNAGGYLKSMQDK